MIGWEELRQVGGPVQALLGCEWGRVLHTPDDDAACGRQAVQIVVLHDAEASVHLKLCRLHVDRLSRETTPRQVWPT